MSAASAIAPLYFDFSDKTDIFVSPIKSGYCADKPKTDCI